MEDQYLHQGNEINLMDYLRVLWRRRRFFFVVLFTTIAIVVAYDFTVPRAYEIVTIFDLGKVGNSLIEDSASVKNKIEEGIYNLKIGDNKGAESYSDLVVTIPEKTSLVIVKAKSKMPQETIKFFNEVSNIILTEHQGLIKIETGKLESKLERSKNELAILEGEKKDLETKEKSLEQYGHYYQLSQQISGSLFLLLDTREKLSQKNVEIEGANAVIESIQLEINDISPTTVVKGPAYSAGSMQPIFLLSIVISVILGSFLGIILIFFGEWWTKNKVEIKKP